MNPYQIISKEYGVILAETNISKEKTRFFIHLLKAQIEKQALIEVLYKNANPMFHYGLRWGRIIPENTNICPMDKSTMVDIDQFDNQKVYAYSHKDQHGNDLPPVKTLQPIIDEIQKHIKIDMTHYDAVIGNIYLNGLFIPPHKDISESRSSHRYPIIVFTLGNNASLGIWDDSKGKKIMNEYDIHSARIPYPPPTNEVLTQNGSIYTIGYLGAKRFDLLHSTPSVSLKPIRYPEIRLPNNPGILEHLRDASLTQYTITLTFRRAQDLMAGMPLSPKIL